MADYQTYLSTLYPHTTWSTTILTGGLVNATHRAVLLSGDAPSSLIIKHARPYVESAGPDLPFSTERQTIEATVLKLWDENGLLYKARQSMPSWITPRLLHHATGREIDLHLSPSTQTASILLLSDLGPLITIVDFLKLSSTSNSAVSHLGSSLGAIMAAIHGPSTQALLKSSPSTYTSLCSAVSRPIVRQFAVLPIEGRIKDYPNASALYAATLEEFDTPKYTYPPSLTFGDFHPGSVLLPHPDSPSSSSSSSTPSSSASSSPTPILLDWEFARADGRGVNGDMAQFLASIRCELYHHHHSSANPALHANLLLFTKHLCASYREAAQLHVKRDADDVNLKLLRSACSLHGREVVNLAHDVYADSPEFRKMVDVGVWYLQTAGKDAEEFATEGNWERLKGEDEGMIQSLFVLE